MNRRFMVKTMGTGLAVGIATSGALEVSSTLGHAVKADSTASVRQHRVKTNGITLRVTEHGSGPAVLFCHGFPAIGSSWRSQMAAVAAAGFRALAPDMRGYGESDAPADPEDYTPFHTVGDLVGLLDQMAIQTAVLVGHDFGANVAWNAAMMRPDRFSAVFCISVPPPSQPGANFLNQLRLAGKKDFYMFDQIRGESDAAWADAEITIPGVYYWTSAQAPYETRWDPFDPARGLLRRAPEPVRGINQNYLSEAVASFSRTGFHGGLNYYRAIEPFSRFASGAYAGAHVHQPSFFLTGTEDGLNKLTEPSEAKLRSLLPGLRGYLSIDGAGHWPQLEAEGRLNKSLLSFLMNL